MVNFMTPAIAALAVAQSSGDAGVGVDGNMPTAPATALHGGQQEHESRQLGRLFPEPETNGTGPETQQTKLSAVEEAASDASVRFRTFGHWVFGDTATGASNFAYTNAKGDLLGYYRYHGYGSGTLIGSSTDPFFMTAEHVIRPHSNNQSPHSKSTACFQVMLGDGEVATKDGADATEFRAFAEDGSVGRAGNASAPESYLGKEVCVPHATWYKVHDKQTGQEYWALLDNVFSVHSGDFYGETESAKRVQDDYNAKMNIDLLQYVEGHQWYGEAGASDGMMLRLPVGSQIRKSLSALLGEENSGVTSLPLLRPSLDSQEAFSQALRELKQASSALPANDTKKSILAKSSEKFSREFAQQIRDGIFLEKYTPNQVVAEGSEYNVGLGENDPKFMTYGSSDACRKNYNNAVYEACRAKVESQQNLTESEIKSRRAKCAKKANMPSRYGWTPTGEGLNTQIALDLTRGVLDNSTAPTRATNYGADGESIQYNGEEGEEWRKRDVAMRELKNAIERYTGEPVAWGRINAAETPFIHERQTMDKGVLCPGDSGGTAAVCNGNQCALAGSLSGTMNIQEWEQVGRNMEMDQGRVWASLGSQKGEEQENLHAHWQQLAFDDRSFIAETVPGFCTRMTNALNTSNALSGDGFISETVTAEKVRQAAEELGGSNEFRVLLRDVLIRYQLAVESSELPELVAAGQSDDAAAMHAHLMQLSHKGLPFLIQKVLNMSTGFEFTSSSCQSNFMNHVAKSLFPKQPEIASAVLDEGAAFLSRERQEARTSAVLARAFLGFLGHSGNEESVGEAAKTIVVKNFNQLKSLFGNSDRFDVFVSEPQTPAAIAARESPTMSKVEFGSDVLAGYLPLGAEGKAADAAHSEDGSATAAGSGSYSSYASHGSYSLPKSTVNSQTFKRENADTPSVTVQAVENFFATDAWKAVAFAAAFGVVCGGVVVAKHVKSRNQDAEDESAEKSTAVQPPTDTAVDEESVTAAAEKERKVSFLKLARGAVPAPVEPAENPTKQEEPLTAAQLAKMLELV